jgi:hypothetical protein
VPSRRGGGPLPGGTGPAGGGRQLVRLVIVRDPHGVEPDDFFFTTDLTATGAEVASRYARRWSIESCFRDAKQNLGGEDPQSCKREGPERAACLSLWLHASSGDLVLVPRHPPHRRHVTYPALVPPTRPPPASSTPSPHSAASCGPAE